MASRRSAALMPVEQISQSILVLRGQRIILDADLAALYGVPTKALNQAVKRNAERFPEDLMFRLSRAEAEALNRSRIVTGHQKHRDPRFPPYAFTEHGAIMAATILSSPRAVEMSLYVIRAFVRLRACSPPIPRSRVSSMSSSTSTSTTTMPSKPSSQPSAS